MNNHDKYNFFLSWKAFVLKLKPIVRDEGMGNPKPSDNIFLDKSLGIHIPDIHQ